MIQSALSWREHMRWNMRLAAPLIIGQLATIGIWTSAVSYTHLTLPTISWV